MIKQCKCEKCKAGIYIKLLENKCCIPEKTSRTRKCTTKCECKARKKITCFNINDNITNFIMIFIIQDS